MFGLIEHHYRENFNRLVRSNTPRMGYDNANDVVQDAYTQAMEYITDGGTIEDVSKFISTVLNNDVRNTRRLEKRRDELKDETEIHNTVISTPARDLQSKQELDRINKMIEEIENPRHRSVLIAKFLYEDSDEVISNKLEMSRGMVSRVVRTFRDRLNEGGNV